MKMQLEEEKGSKLELLARKKGVRVVRDSLRELYTLNRVSKGFFFFSGSRVSRGGLRLLSPTEYLIIIPRTRMGSDSIVHEANAEWVIDSEAMKARGMIVFVKSI